MAVLIVPATFAVDTFKQCVRKGVRGVILISAGFKEVGEEGAKMEQALSALAKKHRIPLIGPNCLGVINTDSKTQMNASFGRVMPQAGRMAFLSQSGALCTAVLDYAKAANIGFSKFVSMGNKADTSELELLQYLADDPQTDVILMYLEDLAHPREMIQLCRKISGDRVSGKPILAIKSGRTLEGAQAASSHTGSLAGSDEVYTAVFAQGGILRVNSVAELFDYAKAFSVRKLPRNNQVAIVTNAGGPGIMTTDACVKYGLEMAPISAKAKTQLRKVLPPTANLNNPIDVIGDAQHDRYEAALKVVSKESHIGSVIVILTPQAMTDIEEIAEVIGKMATQTRKPVLACFMGVVDVSKGIRVLEKWKVPHYSFPESAAKTLSAMANYTAWVGRPRTKYKKFRVQKAKAQRILRAALRRKQKHLTDVEAFSILEAYGFPLLKSQLAKTPRAAGQVAEKLGYPVVLKINSPDILHKVDVGGVALKIESKVAVEKSAAQLLATVKRRVPKARIRGITVQQMAQPGREVILGFKRMEKFGPILMFGLGGTYVEVVKDVTFRIAPIRKLGAYNMIHSIRAYPILKGIRGQKPADLKAIEASLERLSQLSIECPQIQELDINPMVAYPRGAGCTVLDARILL